MLQLLRTRRWIGFTALVVGVIIAFGLLSRWQWSRAEEKRAERNAIATVTSEPAVELGSGAPDEWTHVAVRGTFDAPRQRLVRQRPQDAANGYWVITPLTMVDGRTIWVNRGWLAATGPATSTPPAPTPPSGVQEVTGWWRAFEVVRPEARTGLPAGMVGAVDPDVLPVPGDVTGYLQAEAPTTGLIPVPRPEIDDGRNISYAVQWLLFAVVAIVGWWFFLRREAADDARREAIDVH